MENQLVIFCDDTTPRYVTSVCVLDYSTVAVADKFGSVAIVSLLIFQLQGAFKRDISGAKKDYRELEHAEETL
ncbi:hypothetical protein WR25_06350 [Diploscapter pachys]|uniref:RSE1/DDB1/CPSF1 C-terminal domain-containing protein n=1 Tax=Diploscapter pachys TaxID=2018661 RepID=A0A2A2KM86_9BILA|nr:hypothetical protein WR25_06350 [Diploscapter pachys]